MAESAVAQEVKITLGDGSVVTGANQEEAFQNLAKMKVDTATALKEAKEQARVATEKLTAFEQQQQSAQAEAQRKKRSENGNGFDNEKYFKMLNEDPSAANDYWFENRFQRKPEEVLQQFGRIEQQISIMEQQNVTAAFIAKHSEDFPNQDKQAASHLVQRTRELLNNGLPYNLTTVDYAYAQLIDEGAIKPLDKTQQQEEISPNPNLRGAGSGTGELSASEEAKLYNMSSEDMEKYMRSKGVLK